MSLDIEAVTNPIVTGLDIVSLSTMKKHLRISNSDFDDVITDAIEAAAEELHGTLGALNRTIFRMKWIRYMPEFPSGNIIQLPYPPLISVDAISHDNGESPSATMDAGGYIVRKGDGASVGEIELRSGFDWPDTDEHPRAVGIRFTAGYDEYPKGLIRLVKILAAHHFENPEATINEARQMMINRTVEFGVADLYAKLRVPVSYDDWE